MALFLKYRPQTFEDVVGQTSVIKTLQNAIKTHKSSHAYLFSGSRGTGKTSTARIFAKELIGHSITDPKKKKDIMDQITQGRLVDVIEIDAASNRGIDEIRELRDKVRFAPSVADKKIYIIDEVHMLTTPAFNALLKTLEEPPSHAYFLLATTEMHKLPETIISRCQCFIFQRFTLEQIIQRLLYISQQEKFEYEEEALKIIAQKAEGGMRDAISLLDQMAAENDNRITKEGVVRSLGISSEETLSLFYQALREKDTAKSFQILEEINQNGIDFRTFGHNFLSFLRGKMHQSLHSTSELFEIIKLIQEIEIAITRLKTTPLVELPFEIAVVNLTRDASTVYEGLSKSSLPKTPVSTPLPEKNLEKKSSLPEKSPAKKEDEISKKETFNGFVFEEMPKPKSSPSFPEKSPPETKEKSFAGLDKDLLIEKSQLPAPAKKALQVAQVEIKENTVFFHSLVSVHHEQLCRAENRKKIEKALSEIMPQECRIDFVYEKKKDTSGKEEDLAKPEDILQW